MRLGGLEVQKRRHDADEEAGRRRRRSMEDENERTDPITVFHRKEKSEKKRGKRQYPMPDNNARPRIHPSVSKETPVSETPIFKHPSLRSRKRTNQNNLPLTHSRRVRLLNAH
jgi:hypothetical protein